MRIAVWHNLNSGGGKRALYYHVKGLVERGHYVVSYCPDTVDQDFLPLSDLVEERVFPLKGKYKKKINKFKFLNSQNNILEKTEALLEHCKECASDIMLHAFDVLLANSSSDFYISHIGRFVNIPKIIYLGEPYRYVYEAMPEFLWKAPKREGRVSFKYILKRIKHLYKMYWFSYLCREEFNSASSFDLILVNSIYSKECVKRCYNLESKVCYLGIDTNKFFPNQEKNMYIIGLGLIHESKGIERAIESVSLINDQIRPKLLWIGNNKNKNLDYLEKLKKYAKERSVEIIFKTYITDLELITCLSGAIVLLYLPNLEPFGLALLEANACGTAVVGIGEGGVKETIKNGINGFIVNEFSQEKVAEYLKLFIDIDFAKEFGSKARSYVEANWSYAMGIDNIENYLYEIIKSK